MLAARLEELRVLTGAKDVSMGVRKLYVAVGQKAGMPTISDFYQSLGFSSACMQGLAGRPRYFRPKH